MLQDFSIEYIDVHAKAAVYLNRVGIILVLRGGGVARVCRTLLEKVFRRNVSKSVGQTPCRFSLLSNNRTQQ